VRLVPVDAGEYFICSVTVKLQYNVVMKRVTSSYNLKYMFHNIQIIGVKSS
jgi:peptide subunit release factor RF-3